jgi:hypothetical protein
MKVHLIAFAAVLAALLSVALCVRSSIPDAPADYSDYELSGLHRLVADPGDAAVLSDIFAGLDGTDIIASVRFTGARRQMNYCTLSEVTVVNVIKGDPSLAGQRIALYEYGLFWTIPCGERRYQNESMNLMVEGSDYYVFADKLADSSSYFPGLPEYLPIRSFSGIIPAVLTEADRAAVHDLFGKTGITFRQTANCPVLYDSPEALAAFESFHQAIEERYFS